MPFTTSDPILLIEDDPASALIYQGYLQQAGYHPETLSTAAESLQLLAQYCPAALILDLHLPDGSGFDILAAAHAAYPALPIIVITGDKDPTLAQHAMTAGAHDFILKPFSATRLLTTLRHALQHYALSHEVMAWRQNLAPISFHGFIGQSAPMLAIYRIIEAVAASKASIFISGESGTGKELAAQAIHDCSPRRAHPFVAINCAAIPENLLESHFFGHVKGAFTGAMQDYPGALLAADRGTLFLDEIGELPLAMQAKLLRVLQSGSFTAVGSNHQRTVDLRLIAATNRNLQQEVKAGRFREDLFYRLHVVPLELPPLRERDDDIVLLAEHFLQLCNAEEDKNFTRFTPEVSGQLRRYDWPGNVRQLANLVRRIVVLHDGPEVTPAMVPEDFTSGTLSLTSAPLSVKSCSTIKPLWQMEREAIQAALAATQQDVVKAASLLEVSPSTLYRKLQQWKQTEQHTTA